MQIELTKDGEVICSREDGLVMLTSAKALAMDKTRGYAQARLNSCRTLAEAKREMEQLGIGWKELYGRNPQRCEASGSIQQMLSKLSKGQALSSTKPRKIVGFSAKRG